MPLSSSQILNKGNLAFKKGNLKKAKHFYKLILKTLPNQSDANHNLGVLETSLNNHFEAKKFFESALKSNPKIKQFWISYISNLINLKDVENAKLIIEKSKSFGLSQNEINSFYQKIQNLGEENKINELINLYKNNQYEEVEKLATSILNDNPNDINCLKVLGSSYHKSNNLNAALSIYNKLINLDPNNVKVLDNIGFILTAKKDFIKAEKVYRNAYEINPQNSSSYLNFLSILQKLNKTEEILVECHKLIQLNPNDAQLLCYLGDAYQKQSKFEDAETAFLKAIEINPLSAKIHLNYGNILEKLDKDALAIRSYNKSIELNPKQVEAYNNLGHVYRKFELEAHAEASFEKALNIDPKCAQAYFNLGNLYYDHQHNEKAVYNYDNALRLDDTIDDLMGISLFSKARICDWTDRKEKIDKIIKKINNKEKVITPFPLISLIDNPKIQKENAEIYSKKFPKNFIVNKHRIINKSNKIKIGYFSPDFRQHPIAYSVSELFETHNREEFEVHAFYFGRDTQDKEYFRIKKGVDKFHNIANYTDKSAVALSNNEKIDIAVDLCCYTARHRTNIFAMSAAPIQATFLYAGTMGTNYYDYIIADKTIIPETHKKYYREDILYLPSWQANETKKPVSTEIMTKKDFGIPDEAFVFCSFNNSFKISPEAFDLWAKILNQVKKSVLVLISKNQTTIQNLKNEIKLRGIDPNRLIFVENMESSRHLARLKLMDLSLDTFPCNGGVTSSDSVRMGVPVLTYIGNSFVSRVAASVLNALDLNELIAKSHKEYVKIAIEIAKDPKLLSFLKKKLEKNSQNSVLFNTKLYCKHLEDAFKKIYSKKVN
ncbi:MAG: tetratricopeptide repeat protein [Alphaproteobacteria bacterium]|nr:MAG: tetratricopeptide repeat protein [Alphaproteobacteria bacterium]